MMTYRQFSSDDDKKWDIQRTTFPSGGIVVLAFCAGILVTLSLLLLNGDFL